jgi:ribosome-binding protein aMBF1 (putative translation factor)
VSDPRFVPTSWCVNPKEFGKREIVAWKVDRATTDDGLDQLRVAQVQHDVVCQLWRALRGRGWTVQEYANEVGYTRHRMNELMNGKAILRLEDLAAMERLFGITVMPSTLQQHATPDDDH